MHGVYCPWDVHWARLEASALGRKHWAAYAACPAWKEGRKVNIEVWGQEVKG